VSRILVTGSTDGLGLAAARQLLEDGHQVIAHARNRVRADEVRTNALEPGWVATRMGGASAPDELALGHVTQVWLAEASDPKAAGTGGYYFHQKPDTAVPAIHDIRFQDELVDLCAQLTGSRL
jgi:NAD(P)-dependent dehydrogenase (short-subunit alcohol dehydrogenase family)